MKVPVWSVIALQLAGVVWQPAVLAAEMKPAPAGQEIRIDIPVKLEKADTVFNLDHLAFVG